LFWCPDTRRIRGWLTEKKCREAVVVGGGFIGLEMAENLVHRELSVTIVEKLSQVMPPLDAERELAYKLKDSGARLLVTTNVGLMLPMAQGLMKAGLLDRIIVGDDAAYGPSPVPTTPIPGDDARLVRVDALCADGAKGLPRTWPTVNVDDVALLQYTGGTTGKPKGAMLTHGNLTAACSIYKAWSDPQGLSEPGRDKIICVLPLFHIYALTAVMLRGSNNRQSASCAT
jgi:long-chain acyl-CoA synthetase